MNKMTAAVVACVFCVFASPVTAQSSNLKSEIARSDRFHVSVDYGRTLDQMIRAGKYAKIDSDITPKNFPIDGKGTADVEIILLHFKRDIRDISSAEVNKEIKALGLEPAKIEHLLAFGAQHPEVQRKFTIVFLGACWVKNGRLRVVPALDDIAREGEEPLRRIALYAEREGMFPDYFRFAAIRKNKVSTNTFLIKVDYTQTLREMIAAGKYKPGITAEDLPHEIEGKGIVDAEIVLLHFGRNISSADVNKEIKSRGLEPAKIEHCLAFGAQHPEVQRKFDILFPGASWIEKGGRARTTPCLVGSEGNRLLVLLSEEGGDVWSGDNLRFAAVRTKKK